MGTRQARGAHGPMAQRLDRHNVRAKNAQDERGACDAGRAGHASWAWIPSPQGFAERPDAHGRSGLREYFERRSNDVDPSTAKAEIGRALLRSNGSHLEGGSSARPLCNDPVQCHLPESRQLLPTPALNKVSYVAETLSDTRVCDRWHRAPYGCRQHSRSSKRHIDPPSDLGDDMWSPPPPLAALSRGRSEGRR